MRFEPSTLRSFAIEILEALGTPVGIARLVTDSLVRADLRGYGTHGVGILPLYAGMVDDDAIDPSATPTTERTEGAAVRVDGRAGFGQVAAREATAEGVAVAETDGIAIVGLRDASHIGPVGEFAEHAAAEGMIFLGFTNTAGGAKNTAPLGGAKRKLSTNPIAFGCPTFNALPFDIVADFATSQVAGSVIRDHNRTDEPLHDEWTTTESGDPVESPSKFMNGEGALLPLGGRVTGHKGFALSLAAELLGGLVGRNPVVGEQDPEWLANGAAFVVIDPLRFLSVPKIEARIDHLATHLRSESRVRLPGEGADRRAMENRERGIEIHDHDLVVLVETAAELAVTPPVSVRQAVEDANDVDNNVQTW